MLSEREVIDMYENEIYSNSDTEKYGTYQTDSAFGTDAGTGGAGDKKNSGKKKKGGFRKVLLCAGLGLMFGLFAGAGFYGVKLGADLFVQKEGPSDADADPENVDPAGIMETMNPSLPDVKQVILGRDDVSDVINEVMPAMVSIVNSYTEEIPTFWGQTYTRQGAGAGSGIIIGQNDNELLIVTNNHVVDDTDKLEITFIDGSTAEALVKGTDAEMDLAVVAVPLEGLTEETRNAITVATLGESDDLKLGTYVFAIGNALGYGQTVSDGMISAMDREIMMEDGSTGTFLQTTAAINAGNSGGALFTLDGKVIGINTGKIKDTGVEGMAFAIPISTASPIISQLMERKIRTEKVDEKEQGYLGVNLQTVSKEVTQIYGIPQGAYVYAIDEEEAAYQAGMRVGDVIVKLDGGNISSREDVVNDLQYYKAGDTIPVMVKRVVNGGYESVELEITLGSRPQE